MADNPYSYRSPIVDPDAFYGRSAELERAIEFIQNKACLSFVGEPKIGLTSLLLYMTSDAFRVQCEPQVGSLSFVYIDCVQVHDPLDIIVRIMGEVAPEMPVPKTPNWRNLQGRLIRTLGSLRQQDERRAVILFDDFESLGSRREAFEFLESLRALAQSMAETTLITATRTLLKDCCHADVLASPFPNIFRPEYVEAFSRDEALAFITATSSRSGVDLTPHAETILKLAGTFPYFMQMACSHFYQALQEGHCPDDGVAKVFAEEARPDFDRIWQRLTAERKRTLRALADGKASADLDHLLVSKGYVCEGRVFSSAFGRYIQTVS